MCVRAALSVVGSRAEFPTPWAWSLDGNKLRLDKLSDRLSDQGLSPTKQACLEQGVQLDCYF